MVEAVVEPLLEEVEFETVAEVEVVLIVAARDPSGPPHAADSRKSGSGSAAERMAGTLTTRRRTATGPEPGQRHLGVRVLPDAASATPSSMAHDARNAHTLSKLAKERDRARMKQRIIFFVHVSVDGYVAGPGDDLEWISHGEDVWSEVNELTEACDCALFGRVTYEGFQSYWPAVAAAPDSTPDERAFSRWLDGTRKVVLSATLRQTTWRNSRIVGGIDDAIAAIRGEPGRDVAVFGPGAGRSLMAGGLIDELRILLQPAVVGQGKPLFDASALRRNLRLDRARPLPSGVVSLRYVPPEAR
jgi:dihydrofolate reductase